MPRMRANERRRQLLEVAAEQFSLHGYRGTTTAQLADAAEVTEPILYRHFRNKLDLFVKLIDEVGDEVIGSWAAALRDVEDPDERLEILLAANPATHERGRGIYRVIFHAMTETEGERRIADAIRRHISKLHGFLRRELILLQEEGVVRSDEHAADLSSLLVSVAIGFGMVSGLGGRKPTGITTRRKLHELLEELLAAE